MHVDRHTFRDQIMGQATARKGRQMIINQTKRDEIHSAVFNGDYTRRRDTARHAARGELCIWLGGLMVHLDTDRGITRYYDAKGLRHEHASKNTARNLAALVMKERPLPTDELQPWAVRAA